MQSSASPPAPGRPREIEAWTNVHLVHPVSRAVVNLLLATPVTPNQVSLASVACAAGAAACYLLLAWAVGRLRGADLPVRLARPGWSGWRLGAPVRSRFAAGGADRRGLRPSQPGAHLCRVRLHLAAPRLGVVGLGDRLGRRGLSFHPGQTSTRPAERPIAGGSTAPTGCGRRRGPRPVAEVRRGRWLAST